LLEAIPAGLFSATYQLQQDNVLIGEIDNSYFRERATLELDDGTYNLFRERAMSGDFMLERNGNVVARASKPSAFKSLFEVDVAGHHVVLRKMSMFSRRFGVFEDGRQVGAIYTAGTFTRRAIIDLPVEWPALTRVFLFWLTWLMWRRQHQSASS
jgi:hypothetical protein